MDFTILFNSRNRVGLLQQMLRSIESTAAALLSLEVLVNFDDDDYASLSAIPLLEMEFAFFKPRINPREVNIHINVNKMAMEARGKYIWGLGDDCHILTKHWDKIASERFEHFLKDRPDRIAMGAVESTSVDKSPIHDWYTDAPIITREGRDALGYQSVDRIVDMKEIVFDHVLHNTVERVVNPDQTAQEYRQRQAIRQPSDPWEYDYTEEIALIRSKVERHE
jgi:hypothetical protein